MKKSKSPRHKYDYCDRRSRRTPKSCAEHDERSGMSSTNSESDLSRSARSFGDESSALGTSGSDRDALSPDSGEFVGGRVCRRVASSTDNDSAASGRRRRLESRGRWCREEIRCSRGRGKQSRRSSSFRHSIFYNHRKHAGMDKESYKRLSKKWTLWDSNRGRLNHANREPKPIAHIRNLNEASKVVLDHRASAARPYRTYFVLQEGIEPYFEKNIGNGVLSLNIKLADVDASELDDIWETTLMYLLMKPEASSSSDTCRVLGAVMDRRSSRVFVDLWIDARTEHRGVDKIRCDWSHQIDMQNSIISFDSMRRYMESGIDLNLGALPYIYSSPSKREKLEKGEPLPYPVCRGRPDSQWESVNLE